MNFKRALAILVLFSAVLAAGCQTAKGVAVGMGTTLAGTAEGAAKDSVSLWQAILKLDDWMKKNMW